MMTETELRKKLADLDEFWEHERKARPKIVPVDWWWYINTRDAYLAVLGDRPKEDEPEVGPLPEPMNPRRPGR